MRPRTAAGRVAAALATAALALPLAIGAAAPAQAATPSVGADVSWPQCRSVWPADAGFRIVGLNAGTATTTNPCLAAQLTWARATAARPDVYLNTANPKPKQAAWWPSGDRTRRGRTAHSPYGHCSGGATRACSWVYGASIARDDAETRGVTVGTTGRWWLDVEVQNSWSSSTTRNRAVLEGMATTLKRAGAKVGLYALDHEFRDLIGSVPTGSVLSPLPSWIAGAADRGAAAKRCSGSSLAAGRTLLVQWVDRATSADRDLGCLELTATPKPKVAGGHAVGQKVMAKAGTWKPGKVRLAYAWQRDGDPIDGATKRTYTLKKADAGHRVGVQVTGTESGYSRADRTSASFRAHR